MASVLQDFLPILDDLEALEEKYGNDDFGKSFSALGGAMRTALKELGVEEYSVKEGDTVNKQRVIVVEEEYTEDFERIQSFDQLQWEWSCKAMSCAWQNVWRVWGAKQLNKKKRKVR